MPNEETITSKEFCIWLRGFLDAIEGREISQNDLDNIAIKMKSIKDYPILQQLGTFQPHISQPVYRGSKDYGTTCHAE